MSPTPTSLARQPVVVWFGRVGDLILLSTLLDILHRRYGRPCRLVGAGVWTVEIYRTHRDVAQVDCLRRYTPFFFDPSWWRALWVLRRNRSDPIYVCEYDPRKLKRIRRLLRLSGTDADRCLFLTEEASCRDAHWVDRLVSFGRLTPKALRASDYPWPTTNPPLCAPRLEVSATACADTSAWIRAQGWADRPLVLVQPGNRRTMRGKKLRVSPLDDKAWPTERWAELLRRVHAHMPDAVIVLCGAPRETLLLGWIHAAARLPGVVFAAEIPLERLLALCEAAHSMISVDTGPAHAAAALGLPLLVLFGGHSQAEWLPRSSSGSPVIGIGGPPHSNRLDQIAASKVFDSWLTLLKQFEHASKHADGAATHALRP
jgi:heptosyltransferase-2/heptosyltransferase-3